MLYFFRKAIGFIPARVLTAGMLIVAALGTSGLLLWDFLGAYQNVAFIADHPATYNVGLWVSSHHWLLSVILLLFVCGIIGVVWWGVKAEAGLTQTLAEYREQLKRIGDKINEIHSEAHSVTSWNVGWRSTQLLRWQIATLQHQEGQVAQFQGFVSQWARTNYGPRSWPNIDRSNYTLMNNINGHIERTFALIKEFTGRELSARDYELGYFDSSALSKPESELGEPYTSDKTIRARELHAQLYKVGSLISEAIQDRAKALEFARVSLGIDNEPNVDS